MDVAHVIGNILVFWSAGIGTLSVLVYSRVPWAHSEWGRHLYAYMLAIALVLDLSCARVLFGDSHAFQLVRLAVFVAIPIVMTWRLWLLIKAQHDEDRQSPGTERGAPQ